MAIQQNSSFSYSKVRTTTSESNYAVVKSTETSNWVVKSTVSGNEVGESASTVESALANASQFGIDSSQINSSYAYEQENAPLTQSQITENNINQTQTDIVNATNVSNTEIETLKKYENASVVSFVNNDELLSDENYNRSGFSTNRNLNLPEGAERAPNPKTRTIVVDRKGNKLDRDLRIRIIVPPKYLKGYSKILTVNEGILFPFTPTISYEVKADYGTATPIHSNFPINFYQRSSITPINIQGRFSVENEIDARIYIGVMHLLRSLTRMRFGGAEYGDPDSGAPPPVCRLFGYGTNMFDNVPVVITSYRVELQDSIDYFTVNTGELEGDVASSDVTSVPTLSTIAITCLPMYSREEMQNFSVNAYLEGNLKGKGYI